MSISAQQSADHWSCGGTPLLKCAWATIFEEVKKVKYILCTLNFSNLLQWIGLKNGPYGEE